jgi:hypothetical protein
MLFACPACNRSGKNDDFPLTPGDTALAAEQAPPGQERPILLDPAGEDPIPHIQFRPVTKNGKQLWVPFARNGSQRGATTIRVLKLDRPDLLDLYETHANDHVLPAVKAVRDAINGGVQVTVRTAWGDRVLPLLVSTRPYVALSHDIVAFEIGLGERRRWRLRLPRPR